MKKKRRNQIVHVFLSIAIVTVQVSFLAFAASGQEERPVNLTRSTSTPSNAVPKEDVVWEADSNEGDRSDENEEVASSSEAEQAGFVSEDAKADQIPLYYTKVSYDNQEFYLFMGRDGKRYWRSYGSPDADTLASWYPCNSVGIVSQGAESIVPDEEFMTLAPFVYRFTEPKISDLESKFSGLAYQAVEDMGINPDGSTYSVYEVSEDLDCYELTPEYWFYGYIENIELNRTFETLKWYRCKSDGSISEDQSIQIAQSNKRSCNVYTVGNELHIEVRGSDQGYPQAYDWKDYLSVRVGFERMSYWGSQGAVSIGSDFYGYNESHRNRAVIDKEKGTVCSGYVYNIWKEGERGSFIYHGDITLFNPHPDLKYVYSVIDLDLGGANCFTDNQDISAYSAQAHQHNGVTTIPPDCVSPGSKGGSCSFCNKTVNEVISALGHVNPSGYDITSIPGYKIKDCIRCAGRLETIANRYRIEYHPNGGLGTMQATIHDYDAALELSGNDFVKTGSSFANWNSREDGKGNSYEDKEVVTNLTLADGGAVKLYAQWKFNQYRVTFRANGGRLKPGEEFKEVTYGALYGELPVPNLAEYEFWGWYGSDGKKIVSSDSYLSAAPTELTAEWKIKYRDNGDGTNTRPGLDDRYDTEDDKYYWNSEDKQPATEDDEWIHPGKDGCLGTVDDWYLNEKSEQVFAGPDTKFGTKDDFKDHQDGTHIRSGEDRDLDTEDDELWWNGNDKAAGSKDDKIIHSGKDGVYGTEDDYYETESGDKIYAGMDHKFATEDDFIDHENGTNTRPGADGGFGTRDDLLYDNGQDKIPGNKDDIFIYPSDGGSSGGSDFGDQDEEHGPGVTQEETKRLEDQIFPNNRVYEEGAEIWDQSDYDSLFPEAVLFREERSQGNEGRETVEAVGGEAEIMEETAAVPEEKVLTEKVMLAAGTEDIFREYEMPMDVVRRFTNWIKNNSLVVIEIGVGLLILTGAAFILFFIMIKKEKEEKEE